MASMAIQTRRVALSSHQIVLVTMELKSLE
jgi:hypothetical protein